MASVHRRPDFTFSPPRKRQISYILLWTFENKERGDMKCIRRWKKLHVEGIHHLILYYIITYDIIREQKNLEIALTNQTHVEMAT